MLEKLPGVQAFIGDALDEAAVQSTMSEWIAILYLKEDTSLQYMRESLDGCVAAITTLGGKDSNGKRIDYVGSSNVIEQAGILGCERIILVTR